MRKIQTILLILILIATTVIGYLLWNKGEDNFSGVSVSDEYQSTSTLKMTNTEVKAAEFNQLIASSTHGLVTLGSVIVASTTDATAYLFDATSTDAIVNGDQRHITIIPSSTPAGTYVYDTELRYGLAIQLQADFAGDYVITWR